MKLAIVAVYMPSEEHETLLDIHLDRIGRHTSVPYTIHGGVHPLRPRPGPTLKRHGACVHYLPLTDLHGIEEHSFYLEYLVQAALGDGATHIVTLHADSFPVHDGWVEALLGTLTGPRAFATIERISTACLLFPREFHLTHRPRFVLSAEAMATAAYSAYLHDTAPMVHSGTGYGLAAYRAGLGWHSMRPTAATKHYPDGPGIFDDLVFHLHGAVRLSKHTPTAAGPGALGGRANRCLAWLVGALRWSTPERARRLVRARLKRPGHWWVDQPVMRFLGAEMASAVRRLLADPEGYIEWVRANGSAGGAGAGRGSGGA
jgi:hypothetical protein